MQYEVRPEKRNDRSRDRPSAGPLTSHPLHNDQVSVNQNVVSKACSEYHDATINIVEGGGGDSEPSKISPESNSAQQDLTSDNVTDSANRQYADETHQVFSHSQPVGNSNLQQKTTKEFHETHEILKNLSIH